MDSNLETQLHEKGSLKPREWDYTPYLAVENAAVMRNDLIALFHDNAFGIDVDVRALGFFFFRPLSDLL